MIPKRTWCVVIALTATSLSACAPTPDATPGAQAGTAQASAVATVEASISPKRAAPASVSLPLVVVYKSESCGCCGQWVEHMQQAGFPVQVRNLDDVTPVKQRVGVPPAKGSCHTAEVAGYFIEGHVPADDVKRLLAEKPAAKGLALSGMPAGSPGMDTPDGRVRQYVVELVGEDGNTIPFAQHGP